MSSPDSLKETELSPEVLEFKQQLYEIAEQECVPKDLISDIGFTLAAKTLEEVRQKYGNPDSATYRAHHNHLHALDVIRDSWRQWKPLYEELHDELPEIFDERGFELLMLAGAGHDIFYEDDAATGENEEKSADYMYGVMIIAGYDAHEAGRVHAAIIKTTVEYDEATGEFRQTKIRDEPKDDILGLVLGRADMSGALIEGPEKLFKDVVAIQQEHNRTASEDDLPHAKLQGLVKILLGEKSYLHDRVNALSDDLRYYISNQKIRNKIIKVYRDNFSDASQRSLQMANRLSETPERTRRVVDEAVAYVGRTAYQGSEWTMHISRYLMAHLGHQAKGEDKS